MTDQELMDFAVQFGFTNVGMLNVPALEFSPDVRSMCAADKCRSYGRSWTCPPHCGTLEEIAEKAAAYSRGILVQSTAQMEDDYDVETMMETGEQQKERFLELVKELRKIYPNCLPMSAGTCTICSPCACPDAPCRFPDLGNGQSGTIGISLGTLDVHHLYPAAVFGQLGTEAAVIHLAFVRQGDGVKIHAEIFQRTVAGLTRNADHGQQGVVGDTGKGEHHIPRPQQTEQGHGNGVGTGDQLRAHEACVSPENFRCQGINHVPASVPVAVAGGRRKEGFADLCRPETVQHMLGVDPCDSVNVTENVGHIPFRPVAQGTDFF